jgi:TRAP-type C4-dicarboxylate transport system permease small subunit
MKKILATILSISAVAAMAFAFVGNVNAASSTGSITSNDLGLSYGASIGLGSTDVRSTIAAIIKVAMGLLGIVAVVIVLIGGFKWMTAGGNEDQVGEAKKWIFSGVIGLAIILSAYALASFVINQLIYATTGTNPAP